MRTLGFVTLAFQVQGTPDSGPGGVDFVRLIADAELALEECASDPAPLLRRLLGHHPLQGLAVPARRARHRHVSPGLPQEHQVLRGAVDLRERGQQSARRDLPGGLCGAELAAPSSAGEGRDRGGVQATGRCGASYLEKPRRGRSGASARDELGSEQAREAGAVSRDDREHHAVHRAVRHRVGDHLAFQSIGVQGSTSLSVVAPGIAEALVATAAGLFAAVPAVYFYNEFTTRVKDFATQMDDFALEFLNISERNFTSAMPKFDASRTARRDRDAGGAAAGCGCPRPSPRSTSSRSST